MAWGFFSDTVDDALTFNIQSININKASHIMVNQHYPEREQLPTQEAKGINVRRLRAIGAQPLSFINRDFETPYTGAERIKVEGFAVAAPSVAEQLADKTDRDTVIESNAGHYESVVAELGIDESPQNFSERDSLALLADFLFTASQGNTFDDENGRNMFWFMKTTRVCRNLTMD